MNFEEREQEKEAQHNDDEERKMENMRRKEEKVVRNKAIRYIAIQKKNSKKIKNRDNYIYLYCCRDRRPSKGSRALGT